MNTRPDDLKLADVMQVIDQIDQPQKVVLSKLEAEWIDNLKAQFRDNREIQLYIITRQGWGHGFEFERNGMYYIIPLESYISKERSGDVKKRLVNAILYGYEVEQERLYTVEIPDPNSYCDYRYLSRNDKGICLDASNDTKWKQKKKNQLTEAEIKQDFEWAWQFAKEVEG
ncbi:TPA: DUF1642 domain-containing protein [Streptococcus suis]|nr:DUF1642 domain-containing protein [Streptococcus suis]